MVLPERLPGTEGMDAERLAELVTRDSMIGVARALPPRPSMATEASAIDADLDGRLSPPRDNGELVFAAPWERRAFGLTMALSARERANGMASVNG